MGLQKKINNRGKVEKHRAGLVEKGFTQQFGIDYGENLTLIARWNKARAILPISSQNSCLIYYMYVKVDFSNGILEEEYLNEPP